MKMMPIPSFDSIEEYLDSLPENQRQVTELLRETVYNCLPEVSERRSGYFLVYSYNSSICIILPLVNSRRNANREGVRLGFVKGKLLNDEIRYFEPHSRSKIPTKTFMTVQDIDQDLLRAYLLEAIELDSQKV